MVFGRRDRYRPEMRGQMSGDDSTRRQVLGVLRSGALIGLAGCAGPGGSDTEATCADGAQARSAPRGLSTVNEESLPISDEELVQAALPEDIPAIIDPAFEDDWTGIETTHETYEGTSVISRPRLTDADPIIGVVQEGQGRAYPLRVLVSHEVVNDRFGGPIVVTYCSLCASSVVASRVVAGEEGLPDARDHSQRGNQRRRSGRSACDCSRSGADSDCLPAA